ncbi:MAG: hypothetical protein N4A33_04390 [Bacteriovoracaceae bacterium]|jgi:hypothetical protein|nr:hypothetical protein [Bacteriovoracaceae bacterium]
MKLIILTILTSLNTFACDLKSIEEQFINQTPKYEYHSISPKNIKLIGAYTKQTVHHGVFTQLGYPFDILEYNGSNEYWGAYGAYKIYVDKQTCQLIKITEIYSE